MTVIVMRVYETFYGHQRQAFAQTSFSDDLLISPWAKQSVAEAAALDMIKGKPGNRFDPQGSVTRAEAATIIYRILTR